MQCPECFGLKWCYNKEYDGTSLEYCGPVCPRCGGSGVVPEIHHGKRQKRISDFICSIGANIYNALVHRK